MTDKKDGPLMSPSTLSQVLAKLSVSRPNLARILRVQKEDLGDDLDCPRLTELARILGPVDGYLSRRFVEASGLLDALLADLWDEAELGRLVEACARMEREYEESQRAKERRLLAMGFEPVDQEMRETNLVLLEIDRLTRKGCV